MCTKTFSKQIDVYINRGFSILIHIIPYIRIVYWLIVARVSGTILDKIIIHDGFIFVFRLHIEFPFGPCT